MTTTPDDFEEMLAAFDRVIHDKALQQQLIDAGLLVRIEPEVEAAPIWETFCDEDGELGVRMGEKVAPPAEALDVERLSRAMRVSLDIYGWDLDEMAATIAAEYDRLSR